MSSSKETLLGQSAVGIKREFLDSPESIIGSPFKIPSILGQGSGRGFTFDGLHLPIDWEKAIPTLKQIDWEGFYTFFAEQCKQDDLKPGKISVDSKTGIMTGISIKSRPEASIKISNHFIDRQAGIYEAENVNDINIAIRLQRTASAFLANVNRLIGLDNTYSYIDGQGKNYYSANLSIPKHILETDQSITNDYYKMSFKMRASNIAGRFGLTIRDIEFDNRGIPVYFGVNEGSACEYYLDPNNKQDGRYSGHNIDTPYQAAVLHGIGASFINDMVRRSSQDGRV